MKRADFMDKGAITEDLSMKRADFMDKVEHPGDLSMKKGLFMDKEWFEETYECFIDK